MARSGILCGGCILVDVNKTISRWPPEQEVAFITAEDPQCGGPGFNMAVDLARLGASFPISVTGTIGEDSFGDLLIRTCDAHGLDRTNIHRLKGTSTSYTDVMIVKETGRRTFFHAPAANSLLDVSHFDFSSSNARIFHIGSPGLHALLDPPRADGRTGFAVLLEQALAAGMKTNLELVSIPKDALRAGALPLLPLLSSAIINDYEAEALTGIDMIDGDGVTDPALAQQAARRLLQLGVREVVAIHFPAGAVAVHAEGHSAFHPSVRVPPEAIVSANGAGDAFAAGFMLGLHEAWPLDDSLALGHASAAASLRAASTFEAVIHWQKCLKLAKDWGWRDGTPRAAAK